MYPLDEVLIKVVFMNFGDQDDPIAKAAFMKEWGLPGQVGGFRNIVIRNVANRRGQLTRYAKDEFYFLLGFPKPPKDATPTVFDEWLRNLAALGNFQKTINVDFYFQWHMLL